VDEKAIRGVPWTLMTYAASKGITVVATLVLSRLLVPADFGLVTLATLAVAVFNVFRDLGLGGTLVQRQDLDRRDQGTVLALMLAMGVLVALILVVLSPVLAGFFREPRLSGVLVALSPIVFIGGFNWFYETVMQRELEFRRRFVALVAQSLTYAGVAISLAALGAGVWSLVVGQLVGWVTQGLILVALAPYRVRPRFDPAVARSVLRTGIAWMSQGGLAVLQQGADFIAVGRVLGAGPTGLYSMAFRLSELPNLGISEPVAKVTFPSFAGMHHQREAVVRPFLQTLRLVALVAAPFGVLLSAAAEPFTLAILGEKWEGMIGALAVLGIWGAIKPVQATIGWLLNSVGLAGLQAVLSAVVLVPMVPLLFVAAHLGGIAAVAWVLTADVLVSLLLLFYFAGSRAGVPARLQLSALLPVAIALAVAWGVGRALSVLTAGLPVGLSLVLAAGGGAVSYLLVIHAVEPDALPRALGQIGRTMGRGGSAV
jgi:PST family polysaccharide transporter